MGRYRAEILVGLVLVLLGAMAYSPVRHNEFVSLDDGVYITGNPMVQGGLAPQGLAWAWTTFHASNWHPLTWMSLQLDAQLFGTQPAAFHRSNLLLHLANALLVFLSLRQLTGAVGRSAVVAALFAVHPLHVESVAWAAERKDVLSTFFGLCSILAYSSYARRPGPGRYAILVGCFALSLLAKPMLVTLPFVLLLLDYWPLRRWRGVDPGHTGPATTAVLGGSPPPRKSLLSLVGEKAPFLVLAAFSSLVTLTAQRQGGAVQSLDSIPAAMRLANALSACAGYLVKTVWPVDLAVYYPYPPGGPSLGQTAAGGLLLGAITLLAVWQSRRRPYLLVGWLWFVGTLMPVIGLVQVGDQAMADRYTYVPHIGLFLALVWGAADLLAGWRCPAWVPVGLVAVVLISCSVLTWRQVQHWRNSITLWEHALAVTRGSYRAHANLGATLFDQRRFRDAVPQLRAAVALDARDPELHLLLGQSLLVQNQLDEAVDVLEQSVRLAPDFVPAHFKLAQALHLLGRLDEARQHYALAARLQPTHSEAQLNLGRIDLDRGEFDSARAHFQLALRFNRSDPRAHAGLGQSYLHGAQGRWKEALVHLEDAVKLKPDALEHRRDLAFALYQLGRTGDAEAEYAETLRREPDWPHQAGAVAWEQATHPEARRRSGWEAWRRAQQACQAVGFRDAGLLDVLAAAQAEVGRFDEAVQTAQRAQELARADGRDELAEQIAHRLRLYRDQQPYRQRTDGTGREEG